MKKHAVIIQCHNNPDQINEIIQFGGEGYDFYIHVDKKSNIKDNIVKKDNVFFVPNENRIDVRWGDFSQVEATLALLRMVKDSGIQYAYVHLISGACFWAKNPQKILQELEDDAKQYIECRALPEETTWTWGGLCRFMVSYPKWMIERPTGNQFKRYSRILWQEFIMRTKVFRKNKLPVPKFYGGSSWWSITGKLACWMVDYVESHPEYSIPFEHGILVDEVFFSTLAKYSPYKDDITNECKRYMDWKNNGFNSGPAEIKLSDVESVIKSTDFFARKIVDIVVIKSLEEKLVS